MFRQQFKCTLLTDVILNTKSASEGPNETLVFIPGNCFLGIVAAQYDTYDGQTALDLFHNGKVRFGDAHPAIGEARSLHVPASLFHPKLDDTTFFHFHRMDGGLNQPMKQCRDGYFDYRTCPPLKAETPVSFSIKSAYDRDLRRSQDEKMFGYEALEQGQAFYFEVEADREDLLNEVVKALVGSKRIGRSRSAQYGLVEIEIASFCEVGSSSKGFKDDYYTVYADARLIFLDSYGLPTCQPTAQDLGFSEGASIVWPLSQVRSFQYAPYNWKRKCFDADRFGIEKGSVFVVRAAQSPGESAFVGSYKNEGFGKVIYNPDFLSWPSFHLMRRKPNPDSKKKIVFIPIEDVDSAFIRRLKRRNNEAFVESLIIEKVNEWVKLHSPAFSEERMASQWGAIRSLAMEYRANDAVGLLNVVEDFISHGVSKSLWNKRRRKELLLAYLRDCGNDKMSGFEWLALVNLASTMAKVCNRKSE